jgi:hypothetical protein
VPYVHEGSSQRARCAGRGAPWRTVPPAAPPSSWPWMTAEPALKRLVEVELCWCALDRCCADTAASECVWNKALTRLAFYSAGDVANLLNHAGRGSLQPAGASGRKQSVRLRLRLRVEHLGGSGEGGTMSTLAQLHGRSLSRWCHVSVELRARARRHSRRLTFRYQLYATLVFRKAHDFWNGNLPFGIIAEVSVYSKNFEPINFMP